MAFDFPSSPTIGQSHLNYVWDGEKWTTSGSMLGAVRYDIAQGLTAAQRSQARSNIDVLKKNYIINGAMQISQENGITILALTGAVWPADMFAAVASHGGVGTVSQVLHLTPGGSPNRIRFTVTTADASVAAADFVQLIHGVEGLRSSDLKSGTAAAKQVTLQFGVKAPAGTYGVSFSNSAADRSYVTEFTIGAGEANTDVVKSVTLTLDTAGTWLMDNGKGLDIRFFLMGGANNQTATPNQWVAGPAKYCTANQFNFMGTVGNTFDLFDVSLTEGTVALPFQVPDYASELALCQRYWQSLTTLIHSGYGGTSAGVYSQIVFPVMRAAPTATPNNVSYNNTSGFAINAVTSIGYRANALITATGAGFVTYGVTLSARL